MIDDETAAFVFYRIAGGRCQWCRKKLVFANRGRNGRGAWEIHHHPGKARMRRTFEGAISPDMLPYLRVICWECHKETFGRDFPGLDDYFR